MKAPAAPAATEAGFDPINQALATLEPWIRIVPPAKRRLGRYVLLALALHLAIFLVIRIDNSPTEALRRARTHVTLDSTGLRASAPGPDFFWDRLTDPRLFLQVTPPSTAANPVLPSPFGAHGFDSPLGEGTDPAPAPTGDYPFIPLGNRPLAARVEESLAPGRIPWVASISPLRAPGRSLWQWGSAWAERRPANPPALPALVSDAELAPTVLRLAVDPDGAVVFAVVEQGSGRLDLDQQALLTARRLRFEAVDRPGWQWGLVTVAWAYSATPRETVMPTPPSNP